MKIIHIRVEPGNWRRKVVGKTADLLILRNTRSLDLVERKLLMQAASFATRSSGGRVETR